MASKTELTTLGLFASKKRWRPRTTRAVTSLTSLALGLIKASRQQWAAESKQHTSHKLRLVAWQREHFTILCGLQPVALRLYLANVVLFLLERLVARVAPLLHCVNLYLCTTLQLALWTGKNRTAALSASSPKAINSTIAFFLASALRQVWPGRCIALSLVPGQERSRGHEERTTGPLYFCSTGPAAVFFFQAPFGQYGPVAALY